MSSAFRTTTIAVHTGRRETVKDLTGDCEAFLSSVGAREGLLNVFVPHATVPAPQGVSQLGEMTDLLEIVAGLPA